MMRYFPFALAFLVVVSTQAYGTALVYEPFGGGANATELDTSTTTGVGFGSNTWQDVGTNANHINRDAWSPQFPSNVPFASPNNLMLESNQSGSTTWSQLQSSRNFSGVSFDLGQDGEFYISFSRRVWNNDTWGEISLHNSATGELGVAVGHRWGGNNAAGNPYQITGPLASPAQNLFGSGNFVTGVPDRAQASGENLFYVARVVTQASGNDQVFLKVYQNATQLAHRDPSLLSGQGTGLNQWSLISTGGDSSLVLDQIRISTSGSGYAQFDEIRIGQTWQDVTGLSAAIATANGGFELPDIGANDQIQDVPGWYDSTGSYTSWHLGEARTHASNGTQTAGLRGDGYIYQSLGLYDGAADSVLHWSLEQGIFQDGNSSTGMDVRFYAGSSDQVGEGVDLATLGLAQIGSTVAFASLNSLGITSPVTREGLLDLLGVPAGSEVWMRIGGTGTTGQFAPVDNVQVDVSVPEPGSLVLLALGAAGVGGYVRRRRG